MVFTTSLGQEQKILSIRLASIQECMRRGFLIVMVEPHIIAIDTCSTSSFVKNEILDMKLMSDLALIGNAVSRADHESN